MKRIRQVTSLDLPELAPYRTLRRPEAHFRQGIFVAEGEKLVIRLLDSDLVLLSLLLTPLWLERLRNAGCGASLQALDIFVAHDSLLRQIVGYNLHQGIMAIGRVPPAGSLDNLSSPHVVVALDRLRSAENVGMIARNCAAFGADALVAGEQCCSPYLRRAVRNSMGAVFKLPVVHVDCLAEALLMMRRRFDTRIMTSDPHADAVIYSANLGGNLCIVLGNEDSGISPEVSAVATERICIPMLRQTDSLNVACASAVFLFEACRQRR